MAEGLEKNPAAWRGNLENELRKASEVHRPQSHPYVRYQDLGQFMDRLRHYVDGSCRKRGHTNASLALEFVVLTAARPDEVLRGRWKEIDWHNNIWNKSGSHVTYCASPSESRQPQRLIILQSPVISRTAHNNLLYACLDGLGCKCGDRNLPWRRRKELSGR